MTLYDFMAKVDKDSELRELSDFIRFARDYLDFVGLGNDIHPNIQADIISIKEKNYHFIQYKDDGHNCITRPINTDVFLSLGEFAHASDEFVRIIKEPRAVASDANARDSINKVIYTCQQCIGCTLDAFGNPNKARKRNGLLFEILVKNVIKAAGIHCESYDEKLPLEGKETMKFQHDLVLMREDSSIGGIGQLKTSSKDRIDKIFMDKYMYNKIIGRDIPHFAVFLNDVQRASRRDGKFSISSTFLPGHFKAYTMALVPLDGVYYFDRRPSFDADEELKARIFKFDKFLVEDMWAMIQ